MEYVKVTRYPKDEWYIHRQHADCYLHHDGIWYDRAHFDNSNRLKQGWYRTKFEAIKKLIEVCGPDGFEVLNEEPLECLARLVEEAESDIPNE